MSFVFIAKPKLFFQMFGLVLLMSGCQRQLASFLRIKKLGRDDCRKLQRKKEKRKKERQDVGSRKQIDI